MGLSELEWQAVWLSVRVALAAVVLMLPAGVALGWVLARKDFRGKAAVEAVVNLPLVLPPVVTGYALLVLFGASGPLGALLERWLGVQVIFDWKGAAVAAAVVSLPLMVRAVRVGFAGVDLRLEQAAGTLGASPWRVFCTVTLPLARRGIVAGCVLAFARSMGEFGATIMIAGNIPGQTQTLPLLIYTALQTPGGEAAARRVVVISVIVSVAALMVGEYLERRRPAAVRSDAPAPRRAVAAVVQPAQTPAEAIT